MQITTKKLQKIFFNKVTHKCDCQINNRANAIDTSYDNNLTLLYVILIHTSASVHGIHTRHF